MKCAIELVVDDESQNKINSIRNILVKNNVHDEAVKINHISIADVDVETDRINELKNIVNEFSNRISTFDISLVIAGSFMTSENVLFYSPVINEKLLECNELITKQLADNGFKCNKYYLKNNWFPHCTIGIRLSDEELKKGFNILKENNILPLVCRCEKVDILDYSDKPNYNQIAIYDLKN